MSAIPFAVTVPIDAKYLKLIRVFFQPIMEDHFDADQASMLVLVDPCDSEAHSIGIIFVTNLDAVRPDPSFPFLSDILEVFGL